MLRDFKITMVQNHFYLYPIPVIKEKKYLLKCDSEASATSLTLKIKNLEIHHPDQDFSAFDFDSLYIDGNTRVYVLKASL